MKRKSKDIRDEKESRQSLPYFQRSPLGTRISDDILKSSHSYKSQQVDENIDNSNISVAKNANKRNISPLESPQTPDGQGSSIHVHQQQRRNRTLNNDNQPFSDTPTTSIIRNK